MIVIRDPQNFVLILTGPKYIDVNLKHGIEFIIKSNESLAKNKIKNNTEQLLLTQTTTKRMNYINLFLFYHKD